jgi:hypothetical protein
VRYRAPDLICVLLKICRDGFSAGGNNLIFENNYVVNGDDCLTVGNGAKNITWRFVIFANAMSKLMSGHRDGYCEGSHGLSIGSLGEDGQVASVENVSIESTIMASFLSDEASFT